jgi:hypothetical protein
LPIFLDVEQEEYLRSPNRNTRYEIMWEREASLPEEIRLAWTAGKPVHHLGDIAGNLKGVMLSLRKWSKVKFGAVTKELETLRKRLEELSTQSQDANCDEINKTGQHMDELLYREEMMWLQRSHISWLQEGDCNTKYFHRKATAKAKKNRVKRLRKDDGQVTQDKKEMEHMVTNFFKALYSADQVVWPGDVTQLFQPKISDGMNDELCKEFTVEEISNTLFQIGPLKAPGPDGFPVRFFQKNWDLLRDDVVRAVKGFFLTPARCRRE